MLLIRLYSYKRVRNHQNADKQGLHGKMVGSKGVTVGDNHRNPGNADRNQGWQKA